MGDIHFLFLYFSHLYVFCMNQRLRQTTIGSVGTTVDPGPVAAQSLCSAPPAVSVTTVSLRAQ